MPPKSPSPRPLQQTFLLKKSQILQSLSTPDDEYHDKSPKGSVDAGIRELIDEINAYEGLVTTSSCAGRISVFLEGPRGAECGEDCGDGEVEGEGSVRAQARGSKPTTAPGGKGGGRFLFVSHEPVAVAESYDDGMANSLFGRAARSQHEGDKESSLSAHIQSSLGIQDQDPLPRLIRFLFEPMVCATPTSPLAPLLPCLKPT